MKQGFIGLLSVDRRFLSVLGRGTTCMLFEYSAEISGGRESCLICYVIDTEFCMENKPDSSLHTYFGYIVVGSHICQCFQLIV